MLGLGRRELGAVRIRELPEPLGRERLLLGRREACLPIVDLFDELFLHKTGSYPQMPKPRYAIESWFFGRSGFSQEYAPIAV